MSVWTYGIQLWELVSISNIEILERFQSKVLRILVNAFVSNKIIRRDLKIETIKNTIKQNTINEKYNKNTNILRNTCLD